MARRYAKGHATLEDLSKIYDVCDNDAQYEREPVAFYVQNAALHVAWRLVLGEPDHTVQPDVFAAETTPVCILDAMYRLEMRKGTNVAALQICDVEHAAQLALLHEIIGNPFRS